MSKPATEQASMSAKDKALMIAPSLVIAAYGAVHLDGDLLFLPWGVIAGAVAVVVAALLSWRWAGDLARALGGIATVGPISAFAREPGLLAGVLAAACIAAGIVLLTAKRRPRREPVQIGDKVY